MPDRFERFSLAISEISRCWRRLATEELAKYGLKSPHAIYLNALSKHPDGVTVPALCERIGKDKSDASRMIAILEERGLAQKKDVGGSLYRGLWVLTEQGRHAAEQVALRARRAVEIAGRDLTEDTRELFYRALESVAANLSELTKKGIPE